MTTAVRQPAQNTKRGAALTAGVKYTVGVTRRAPDTFSLWLNGSRVDAVARRLNDGGLLVQVQSPALLNSPH